MTSVTNRKVASRSSSTRRLLAQAADQGLAAAVAGNQLYATERESRDAPWPEPINLGSAVNSTAAETRPSLSWDARTLYFGSTRVADQGSDIYVTMRLRKR